MTRDEQEALLAKLQVARRLAAAGETAPADTDADLAFFAGAFAAGATH